MSRVWACVRATTKFYARGIRLYPTDELYREIAFVAYYNHWSQDEIMNMDHNIRRRWCAEISEINKNLNPSKNKKEKNIFELKSRN